jgi:hypothetical protein
MHTKSDEDLRSLFHNMLAQPHRENVLNDDDHWSDFWTIFQDEARARYSREDDGDGAEYMKAVAVLFDEEKADCIMVTDDA